MQSLSKPVITFKMNKHVLLSLSLSLSLFSFSFITKAVAKHVRVYCTIHEQTRLHDRRWYSILVAFQTFNLSYPSVSANLSKSNENIKLSPFILTLIYRL